MNKEERIRKLIDDSNKLIEEHGFSEEFMRVSNEAMYCGNCDHLNPKEHDQTKDKEHHVCTKYKIQVRHLGHHPNILKCKSCLIDKEE